MKNGFTLDNAETFAVEHVTLLDASLATKTDIAEVKADIVRLEANVETLHKIKGLRRVPVPGDNG